MRVGCRRLGFDLHWDDHEVFILQVFGSKKWTVYTGTSAYPLTHSPEVDDIKPSEPVWEGLLEPGDVIYIPRGWWHSAVACDELTLHLTVGLEPKAGLDILGWLTKQLVRDDHFREDVPCFTGQERQKQYLSAIGQHISAALQKPALLEDSYLDSMGSKINRPAFSLPWSACENVFASPDGQTIATVSSFPTENPEASRYPTHRNRDQSESVHISRGCLPPARICFATPDDFGERST